MKRDNVINKSFSLLLTTFFFMNIAVSTCYSASLEYHSILQNSINPVDGLDGPHSVVVSPDGNNVYVVGSHDHKIATFSRNVSTGVVTFTESLEDGVGGVDGLWSPRSVAISPDGNNVYTAGFADLAIGVFSRNATTGTLTFFEVQKNGVDGVEGLGGVTSVTVSPDGNHVYAAGLTSHAVAVFARHSSTGALTFVEVLEDGVGGVTSLRSAQAVTLSPDGAHVYATGRDDNAITVFSRNASTGVLTVVEVKIDGSGGVDGLEGAWDVTVSLDGKHVYATGYMDNSLACFTRKASTGELTFIDSLKDGIDGVDGLSAVIAVTVSPDGSHVYTAAFGDDAVTVFSRNSTTGVLTFIEVLKNGINGIEGLDTAYNVTVSPDGDSVYSVGSDDDALVTFSRNVSTGELLFDGIQTDGDEGITGLNGASSVAVSSTDDHLYITGIEDNALVIFSKNSLSGALTFVEILQNGIDSVEGLAGVESVAVSPDDKHVYTAGHGDNAVAVFSRDASTGTLTFVEIQKDGDFGVDGLAGTTSVVVSPDGSNVYATGRSDHAVAVFSRNTTSGALTFLEVFKDGSGTTDGLNDARSVTMSPDGNNVYAAGYGEDAVAVFTRNTSTGLLTFLEIQKDGIGEIDGLNGVTSLSVSPDGSSLYAAGVWDDAIAVFSRNTSTGALTFIEMKKDGINSIDGLDSIQSVVVAPDGRYVYIAAYSDDAVTVFNRNLTTGALTFIEMQKDASGRNDGLDGASGVTVSPDGHYLYVAGKNDDAVTVFKVLLTSGDLNSAVSAERQKWDANNDGKIGLEEVIHGLQVVSGD